MIRYLFKLRYLLSPRFFRREFDDEVDAHIAMLAERFQAQGMPREKAWQAAHRQFGNLTGLKEEQHQMQTFMWLDARSGAIYATASALWPGTRYSRPWPSSPSP
jgi:hypothetical protein